MGRAKRAAGGGAAGRPRIVAEGDVLRVDDNQHAQIINDKDQLIVMILLNGDSTIETQNSAVS